MTELERFAVAILAQRHTEGGGDADPIEVSALLDRVLPYPLARRMLGIDISEDYEAMVLRLLAEEGGLVSVTPRSAAELAQATTASKLPDLSVLQLLRGASITLTTRTIAALSNLHAPPSVPAIAPAESEWAPVPVVVVESPASPPPPPPPVLESTSAVGMEGCWACLEPLPTGPNVKFCPFCGADQRQPTCPACGAAAQIGWKHCAECGAKL